MNQPTLNPEQLITKVLQELQEIKKSLSEIRDEIKEIKEQRLKTSSSTQTSSNSRQFQPNVQQSQSRSETMTLTGKISRDFELRQTKDDKKRDFYFAFLAVEQKEGMSEKEQEYIGKEIKVFFFEPNFDLTMALQKVRPEHEITVVGFFNNRDLFTGKELENHNENGIII